jgi:hypothetical protein
MHIPVAQRRVMMEEYQVTFDDIERANRLTSQPGRTAYIDECGNFGFDFEKSGTSSHYIVCAVVVDNKNIPEIERKVDEIRRNNFGQGEMKSSSIASKHSRRAKILTELLVLDFSLIILVADKQAFYEGSPLTEYKGPFVKYLHQKLYDSMYVTYPKLKIIEDEYGASEFQQGYRKYITDNRPTTNLFNEYDFDYIDSRDCNIVQIADIVAGSVMQHILEHDAPDVLKIFGGKIRDIVNFPKTFDEFIAGANADTSFDKQIYELADRCASNYIENNKNTDEEEIRLRVLFLRKLIFTARNVSESKFIYSAEITRWLTSVSGKRVTRDFLYRKIIPQLRDSDILIASSAHGYKLPTCIDDIYAYINQTNGVVNPMLSRIGKCRSLILKQTDGFLSIF